VFGDKLTKEKHQLEQDLLQKTNHIEKLENHITELSILYKVMGRLSTHPSFTHSGEKKKNRQFSRKNPRPFRK
jgi:hypothetical protein